VNDLHHPPLHLPVLGRAPASATLSTPSVEEMSRHGDVRCLHCQHQFLCTLHPELGSLTQNGFSLNDIIQTWIENISSKCRPVFQAMHHKSDAGRIAHIIANHDHHVKQLSSCMQSFQSEEFRKNPVQTLIKRIRDITTSITIIGAAINRFSNFLGHLNEPITDVEAQYAKYIQKRINALERTKDDCTKLKHVLCELQTHFQEENESDFAARIQKLVDHWQLILPRLERNLQTLESNLLQQATQIKQMQQESISKHHSKILEIDNKKRQTGFVPKH